MNKKIFAVLMSIMMLVCFMPTMAFADVEEHTHNFGEAFAELPAGTDATNYIEFEGKFYLPNKVDTAPTCTEAGIGHLECACGEIVKYDVDCDKCFKGKVKCTNPNCDKGYVWELCPPHCNVKAEHKKINSNWYHKVKCEICNGTGKVDCTVCKGIGTVKGEPIPAVIPALGHDYTVANVVAPTCTTDGYTWYSCSICGKDVFKTNEDGTKFIDTPVKALGHNYQWIVVKAPTFTTVGSREYRCTRCNEWEGHNAETIPMLTLAKGVKPTVKAGKKYAKVTVKKVANASKYQIAYKVKGGKYKYKIVAKTGTYKIKNLKKGKKYTFKVRALGYENGVRVLNGAWSSTKTVTIK